jgi:hypothetical protein
LRLASTALVACVVGFVACSANTLDVGSNGAIPMGAPCIPSPEMSSTFLGFDYHQVVIDHGNPACGAGVCLVNHFQGLTTCPYGQNAMGTASFEAAGNPQRFRCASDSPSAPCCTPGSDQPVIAGSDVGNGNPSHSAVPPQCSDRTANRAVTCSCRCANSAGKTDDGGSYCTCPSGMSCTQVEPAITARQPLDDFYCVANDALIDFTESCPQCVPAAGNCSPTSSTQLPGSGDTVTTYYRINARGFQTMVPWLCISPPEPARDSKGLAACTVDITLAAASDSCANHPGMTDVGTVAGFPVCALVQLPAGCESSSQLAWCYETGAAAMAHGCPDGVITFSSAAGHDLTNADVATIECP